ncbi:hypothetical protein [Ornithinimicrobium cerasi]|nr:hypothetical protein [Ornithinimicrobium cerasi]
MTSQLDTPLLARAREHSMDERSPRLAIGMNPHKRSVTIEG